MQEINPRNSMIEKTSYKLDTVIDVQSDDNLLFEWKEISYSVELPDSKTKETKVILQNNSGRVKSGEIVAM